MVPPGLTGLRTTFGTQPKFYDQIAWFMGDLALKASGKSGVIDYSDAVFTEMTRTAMSFRMSDHLPLWTEFIIDRSWEQMAEVLGIDPAMPDPFDSVPD